MGIGGEEGGTGCVQSGSCHAPGLFALLRIAIVPVCPSNTHTRIEGMGWDMMYTHAGTYIHNQAIATWITYCYYPKAQCWSRQRGEGGRGACGGKEGEGGGGTHTRKTDVSAQH